MSKTTETTTENSKKILCLGPECEEPVQRGSFLCRECKRSLIGSLAAIFFFSFGYIYFIVYLVEHP